MLELVIMLNDLVQNVVSGHRGDPALTPAGQFASLILSLIFMRQSKVRRMVFGFFGFGLVVCFICAGVDFYDATLVVLLLFNDRRTFSPQWRGSIFAYRRLHMQQQRGLLRLW